MNELKMVEMTQTIVPCAKCNYVRQASDTVPEWQCPSCGVVYEKIPPPESTQSVQRQIEINQKRLDRVAPARGSRRWKLILAGTLVLLVTCFGLFRTYQKQKAASKEAMERLQQIDELKRQFRTISPAMMQAENAFKRGFYAEALPQLEKLADQGDARAMMWLWQAYHRAQGAAADAPVAKRWLELAVYAGYPSALVQRGLFSENGEGGYGEDLRLASDYYRKAAAEKNAMGLMKLAHFYNDGIGRKQDFVKALTLLNMSKLAMEAERDAPDPFYYSYSRNGDFRGDLFRLEQTLTPVEQQLAKADANTWFADTQLMLAATE